MNAQKIGYAEEQIQGRNEAALSGGMAVTDERLVKVGLKIRDARAKLKLEYEAADKNLRDQLTRVSNELIRRLNERGATQTKTTAGTAYFGEEIRITIADPDAFRPFVLQTQDLDWYPKRVSVEHLREWMTEHGGVLPPGLSVFRERTINMRAPRKANGTGQQEPDEFVEQSMEQ